MNGKKLLYIIGFLFITAGLEADNHAAKPLISKEDITGRHTVKINKAIEKGADINAKDSFGETPLMIAATTNALDIARLLIQKGADVNAGGKEYKHTAEFRTFNPSVIDQAVLATYNLPAYTVEANLSVNF